MLSNKKTKKGCLKRKNVGLDLVFVVLLYWSTDDMCHQEKFLKGTRDLMYKDGCEPT